MAAPGDRVGVSWTDRAAAWARAWLGEPRIWLWLPAILACAIGFAIVVVDKGGSDGFGDRPQFYVWAVIIAIQSGVWVVVAGQSLIVRAGLRERFGHAPIGMAPLASWVLLVLVLLVVSLGAKAPMVGSPLPGHRVRVLLLSLLGVLAATPAVLTIWGLQVLISRDIGGDLARIEPGAAWSSLHQQVFERLCDVRSRLQRLLSALGAIVAAMTLASGALRNAVVAWRTSVPTPPRAAEFDYPLEYVLIYGLFFTALVALIYAPVYATLERAGSAFVDRVYVVPSDKAPSAEWVDGRDRLSKLLQLGIRAEDSIRSGVAIFAPLLATLVSTLLPGSK